MNIELSQMELAIGEFAANFALEHGRGPFKFEIENGMTEVSLAKKPLSPGEQEIFEFVERVINSTGESPTRKEAGEAVGIAPSWARQRLKGIERKGWIRLPKGKHRGIELI